MRNVVSIIVIAAGASLMAPSLVRAQSQSDPSPSSQRHVQQHQQATPPGSAQNAPSDRDQSAEVPQSRAVISPPKTGDHSVITPPATGAAKTPVIKPPGTAGNNEDVQPK